MPQLPDSNDDDFWPDSEDVSRYASRFWGRFSDFALRDNVLEVALGLIIAAAFAAVVTSFVSDILLPILSLLPFIERQFDEKFAVLRPGPNYKPEGYNTLQQAIDDGALVLAWGMFLDKVFHFIGIALCLYALASLYTWVSDDPIIHETIKCRFCRKRINVKAKRCIECTTWQDGREERPQ